MAEFSRTFFVNKRRFHQTWIVFRGGVKPGQRLLLTAWILFQGVLVYHFAFQDWTGPGDFGNNINYIPAILIGAGRGFKELDIDTIRTEPALNTFIEYKAQSLDVSSLPENLPTKKPSYETRTYQYLYYTVGFLWRLFGIRWNVVRVLIVFCFFLTCLVVYRICRLALPVTWSLLATHAFAWNLAVLESLYSFRDFSKALFILCAVLLVSTAIRKPVKLKKYLCIAC